MPAFIHPVIHKNIATLLAECTDTLKAEIIGKKYVTFPEDSE
jgi:2-amino-4-hydroxy-6-hydroxymethyldihydropteridine diphosphokinase